ncbi:hypothetical protein LOX60_03075 [Latilactobacillus curvatus]|uniref:hypothetical protein n=1 Tax=Latilactobacillus curvatus TaxID=28038 RepID=UPI0020C80515|nr:hypothetical protein [Latilactobacillus curvatus]MCP8847901.1 hypothetical protein [Latilactobacillus curvatus]MCP8864638.1 hypothetical protein [Latilactobacillus curvatus]MCP8873453.1 hypothetical protein [Latilactobacillus curvatus]MCP8875246.1 hypothetical protein [Latilactobacillus curvatus]MCP8878898.1 hypothetical protein [Latilactobacillus curvatus]
MADEIKRDTVDYRDPTPFDNSKLQSLSEISKAMRHKTYGEDTREAMAQQGEALVKIMQETGGNQSAEVVAARSNFELLGIREDAQDNAIAVINANKADKTEIAALKSETDAKLSVKRNTATKIKRADMDTSNDGAKLGLINLSEEVQAAMAGKAPVIGSVENGSITEQKIAAGAITGDKLVQSVLSGYSLIVGGEIPNYDQSTRTFTFGDSPKLALIAWGSIHRFQIPKGLKIINTPENDYTATRLMFNTESLSFRFISWDNNYEPAEICIMSVRADWGVN